MTEETALSASPIVPRMNQEKISRELRVLALEREELETAMIEALEKRRIMDIADHLKQ